MKRSPIAAGLTFALIAALPLAANAQALSYNYVEGGYVATNTDGGDADGFGGNASFAIHPNFHVFGGYANQEIDGVSIDGPIKIDVDQWRVGLGYNHAVAANTDLVTRLAYEKFQARGIAFDADGWSAEVGARHAFTPNFEGHAMAGYEDGDSYDGDFYGRLGAQVKFNPNWGISGDVKIADGDTQWFVGPRFTF
jgi:Ax21 family sulfation-dependent quorum factor